MTTPDNNSDRSFTFEDTFYFIAEIIDTQGTVDSDAIATELLAQHHDYVAQAAQVQHTDNLPQVATNMVAWFSAKWSQGLNPYIGRFERTGEVGSYVYSVGEPSGAPALSPSIERPDFNMVARLDGENYHLDDVARAYIRDTRLVRHHPAGCHGHGASLQGRGTRGWYVVEATPEELANKRPCLRCIAMLERGSTRGRRSRRDESPRPLPPVPEERLAVIRARVAQRARDNRR